MGRYYAAIFGDAETFDADLQFLADGGKTPAELRDAYAMPPRTIRDPQRQGALNSFFFWAAWACATERPAVQRASSGGLPEVLSGQPVTYTNNWPAEPLIDNRPSGAIVLWSVLSFVALLAGVGALAWYYAVLRSDETVIDDLPDTDPLLGLRPTPSMLATRKYFWVVAALVVVQVGLGAVTAHYGVEGQGFYGVPLADPIRVMEWEHEQAAAALRQMRDLTDDFTAPNWACDTLRALLEALAQLEHDLHQHVHKENNVLFPKVLGVPG
jgi:nitric oxide reductase subunit B